MKEAKIPTTDDLLTPMRKTIQNLDSAKKERQYHMESNQEAIMELQARNANHQKEITKTNKVIHAFKETFGVTL